jgi:transcriptional regulator with XRE-family HTH domain
MPQATSNFAVACLPATTRILSALVPLVNRILIVFFEQVHNVRSIQELSQKKFDNTVFEAENCGMFDGARMRSVRKRAGLTQAELARQAGCDRNTVSRIELGHFRPRPALAERMAQALAVPLESLYAREDFGTAAARHRAVGGNLLDRSTFALADDQLAGALNQDEREIVLTYRRLPLKHRERVWGFVMGLAASGSAEAAQAAAKLAEAAAEAERTGERREDTRAGSA